MCVVGPLTLDTRPRRAGRAYGHGGSMGVLGDPAGHDMHVKTKMHVDVEEQGGSG